MINFKQSGNFSNLNSFLQRAKRSTHTSILDKYGKEGVRALSENTPVDTGLTAASWRYEIVDKKNGSKALEFYNDNIQNGHVCVAIILQYGHATKSGGFVKGIDYVNPAIQPIFNKIAEEAWKEVNG